LTTIPDQESGFRRLTVRYERREDIHLAFTTLATGIICLKPICRLR